MATTTQIRSWWAPACVGPFTKVALYGKGIVSVRGDIVDAVHALSTCLERYKYATRFSDTGAYNCRKITGGSGYSLHAYGIALDINWSTNPYGRTLVTDMPPAMVKAIKAIRTRNGKQVWRWGGDYVGNKDAMHFEVVCHPADLATGINPSSLPSTAPKPTAPKETALADNLIVKGQASSQWWITDGIVKRHINDLTEAGDLVFLGLARWAGQDTPFVVRQAMVDDLHTLSRG